VAGFVPMSIAMRRENESVGLLRATLVGVGLFVVSTVLLGVADEALDVAAVAGGIGVVMSGALLGLTILVARWRGATAGYVATNMATTDDGSFVAGVFDDPDVDHPHDDVAAI
jgi:hypothetical protein